MRSHADYAVFALNNTSIGGSQVLVSKFFLNSHTQITTAYMRLGQYIGQDHHTMDASSFVPWSPAMAMSAPSGSARNYNTSNNYITSAAFPGPSSLHFNPPAPSNVASVDDL